MDAQREADKGREGMCQDMEGRRFSPQPEGEHGARWRGPWVSENRLLERVLIMDGMQAFGLIGAGLFVLGTGILGGWIIGTAARDIWAEMRRQDRDEN